MSQSGLSVVMWKEGIRVIAKNNFDITEWVLNLPKELIVFILSNDVPQLISIMNRKGEEIGWTIDAICYSPVEGGFITYKNIFRISK